MATIKHVPWYYPETTSDDWVEYSVSNPNTSFMSYWKLDNRGEPFVSATKAFYREPHLSVKECMKNYYEEMSCNL
jgi:hypothetical protein